MKRLFPPAFALCLFLLIVGAKWATFDRFGSPLPDWDQWDAEALELFVPWFTNDNFLQHLFHPHNEHRVILTKLQNLALVLINGQWDSRLEAVTNAMLHAVLALGFWAAARRWLAARWLPVFFILLLALFALPVAWQNVLGGFHSQQYWLLALSFAAITVVPFARSWSAAWWAGVLSAGLALGSMGSGFLAAGIVIAVVAWLLLKRETTLRAVWPTLLFMAAIVLVGLLTRVEVEWHEKLKAKTAHDFVFSIVHSLQWPLRDAHWAAPVMWLPWAIVGGRMVRSLAGRTFPPAGLTLFALGGWVLVQLVATAYARGAGADYPASRYMDTLAFGAVVNAAALGWLVSGRVEKVGPRLALYAVGCGWLLTLGLGLREVCERNLRYELPDAKKYYLKAEGHMRRYLATDDKKQLAHPDIPFPSAEGLIERLAIPSVRRLMPLPIRAPSPIAAATGSETPFLVNDARGDESDTPPRLGLSPTTAPLDAAISWGSFGADGVKARGKWQSAPIAPPEFRWLKFETAGDLGRPYNHDVSLALHDAQTGALLASVLPSRRPRDTWRAAYVRSPDRPFVIVASDQSASGWLAFSAPVEMGGASYWAWQAAKHGRLIMYLAAAALGGLLLLRCGTRFPARGEPRLRPAPESGLRSSRSTLGKPI